MIKRTKLIFPATLGTLLEWAEYTFFAYMADKLSALFFVTDNPDIALIKTYGIFATSYLMRPIGAVIFGFIGDKKGRKPALVVSMLLMCFATTAMGCLPTYQNIGLLAPILLMICRLLQGIAIAGEFNGAAVYMIEHLEKRPFLAGSFAPFGAAAGMAMGSFAAMVVSKETAPLWAWRIPFLMSGFLGVLAVYLRVAATETPIFQKLSSHSTDKSFVKKSSTLKLSYNQTTLPDQTTLLNQTRVLHQSPLKTMLKNERYAFFMAIALSSFIAIYVCIGNIYYKSVCIKIGHLEAYLASQIITFGQLLAAILILSFGLIADKIAGKKLCLTGLMAAIAGGPIILQCAQSGDVLLTIAGQIIYAVINGMISATVMTLLITCFKPESRYTGSSLGWSLSAALFGGTALIVPELLMTHFGLLDGPGFYISLAATLAFGALSMQHIQIPRLKLSSETP